MKDVSLFALLALLLAGTTLLCVCVGSVPIPPGDTLRAVGCALRGLEIEGMAGHIVVNVRLPRALCVALTGAALSLCGAAMQGLLRNPLADGSTLGVSSGAALGAVAALALGAQIPALGNLGAAGLSMLAAFVSLVLILSLSYALDRSLSTNTIILLGVIFSMFCSSLLSLIVSFSGERLRAITFWTMGSLAGTDYGDAALLLGALLLGGGAILAHARELNAFAIGEENARSIGVRVRRVKLTLLVAVAALIGVCVAVGGTIGFVGLVVPHMTRMRFGPNHRRLLPLAMGFGGVFLLLCDLAARTLLAPVELSIGVVTSLIGAAMFLAIFYPSRKAG